MPLEIRLKVLRRVSELCKKSTLELVLVKIWKVAKELGSNNKQIGFLDPVNTDRESLADPEITPHEAKFSLTQMIILDLSLYHTFMALVCLCIAKNSESCVDIN